jgi:ATP-dependent DNA ligase
MKWGRVIFVSKHGGWIVIQHEDDDDATVVELIGDEGEIEIDAEEIGEPMAAAKHCSPKTLDAKYRRISRDDSETQNQQSNQLKSGVATNQLDSGLDVTAKLPGFILPMMASLVKDPFDSPDWIFETKLDGYRAIAVIDSSGKARLWSRNRLPLELKFPTVRDTVNELNLRSTILDGKIVAQDEEGVPECYCLTACVRLMKFSMLRPIFPRPSLLSWMRPILCGSLDS